MVTPEDHSDEDRAVSDLWRFYDEHAAQARQHETLRATVTSILAGFAAALVGFAGVGGLDASDAPAGALVIAIGLLGALLSLKHYERNRFHTRVLRKVRDEITKLRTSPHGTPQTMEVLRRRAETEHRKDPFRRRKSQEGDSWFVRISLFHLWLALDMIVTI